ncbi:MAG: cytoplasmic protein [Cyanobacteria bacterium SZAS LIN-5]|nr:cytoplasmic protein [Cyanobacteria bacterium SZAS LIN-5]
MDLSVKTLKLAHKASSNHRTLLNQSELCGCFYCEATFSPEEIREYTDRGQTALCPRCSIDSVIPAAAGYALTAQFLSAMEKYWFAEA